MKHGLNTDEGGPSPLRASVFHPCFIGG